MSNSTYKKTSGKAASAATKTSATPSKKGVSKLGFALLGQLARGQRTGYELSREFERDLAHFWNAKHSQIYTELQKLQKANLVEVRQVRQSTRPDKKVYEMTSQGNTLLLEWLQSPLPNAAVRSELHLRTHSIHLLPRPEAIAFFQSELERATADADLFKQQLAEIERACEGLPPVHTQAFSDYANLKFGLENRKQVARWARWLVASL